MSGEDLLRGLNYVQEEFIEEAETVTPKGSMRRVGLLFLIAAMISLLGVVAFASTISESTADWFFSFFGDDTKQAAESVLSQNQSEILEAGLVEINQSVTDNGYTITLESGLCDGYRALIKCRIDAPEGVFLNGIQYALDYESRIAFSGGVTRKYRVSSYTGYPLEDEDPNDNSITELIEIILQPAEGESCSLADGSLWGFSFHSIEEMSGSGEDIAYNTLCEGNWDFEVIFEDNLLVTGATELLTKPVKCLWDLHIRNRKIPLTVKIVSFELRSLTATIRYKRPLVSALKPVYLNRPIYLVLKDGSKVLVEMKAGSRRDEYDELLCLFDCPVSAEDVEYIEFPGAGKVDVSSERSQ